MHSNGKEASVKETDSPFDSIDFKKLASVAKKSALWIVLIFSVAISVAYLTIRYTRPLFQSASVLQLDVTSEAQEFGFKSFDNGINNLSKEIELIRSRLFFSKVAEVIELDVNYYQYGDVLFEERYGNNPFEVKYVNLLNNNLYNRNFDVDVLNNREFVLRYFEDGEEYENTYSFGRVFETPHFEMLIEKTDNFKHLGDPYFFFVINSEEAQINYIANSTSVEPLDFNAKTINIFFKDHNKYKARDVVTAIDTLYIYYTQLEKNKANDQKIKFLNSQLQQTEERLTDLENYFENFTIDNKTTNLNSNLGKVILMLEALDSQRFVLQHRIEITEKVIEDFEKDSIYSINPYDVAQLPNEVKSDLTRIQKLKEEKEILLASYNENTLVYAKKVQEINILNERIQGYLTEYNSQLNQRLDELEKRQKLLESDFIKIPSKQTEYTKTKRFYTLYEEFYLSLMQNKAQFELAQAGVTTDYKILSPANLPSKPVSPDVAIIYGIAVAAGIFMSVLVVFILYFTHNKISGKSELARLTKVPILGEVPVYDKVKLEVSRLVIDKHPKSEVSEAFRSIRTNLEFLKNKNGQNVIAVTSTVSGEGKTFVAVNLGGIISLLKNKVVLLDLDMRKPRLQKVFYNNSSDKGVSTILIDKHKLEECIFPTNLENLDYIPSGPIPPNPSELLADQSFDKLLIDLNKKYDVIIMDTPPVGLVTDAVMALRKANLPIYIVRSDFSTRTYVKGLNELVDAQKLDHLSIILNASSKIGKYGYGKKHGYYQYVEEEKKPSFSLKGLFGL